MTLTLTLDENLNDLKTTLKLKYVDVAHLVGGIWDEVLGAGQGTSFSGSAITMKNGDLTAVIKGSNFGTPENLGGTVKSVEISYKGKILLTASDINESLPKIVELSENDFNGITPFAIEEWIAKQNVKLIGTSGKERLVEGTLSVDGYPINPEGDDNIDLKGGNDTFFAGDGNDTVKGGDGKDNLWGGDGDDVVKGGGGKDKIWGGDGNDKIEGGGSSDRMYGGAGNDKMQGGDGNDRMSGGAGNDRINGGDGNDRAYGNEGNDKVWGNDGNDRLYGSAGSDRVYGGDGRDRVSGGEGNDRVYGNKGNDRLYGNEGDDRLYGGSGKDTLNGGEGNDTLKGDGGNDKLTGGAGADVFVFSSKTGKDVVTDFEAGVDSVNFGSMDGITKTQSGDDLVLSMGDATLTLLDTTIAEFEA